MTDPRLVPILDGAHHYTNYVQFMTAHRHRLQRTDVFQEWDGRLQEIVEEQAKRWGLRLEEPRHWDVVENRLSVPLHCAFWFGWETVHNLKKKYEIAVDSWHAAHPIQPTRAEGAGQGSPLLARHASPLQIEEHWEAQPMQDVPHSPGIIHKAQRLT